MDALDAIMTRRTVPQVKMAEPGPDDATLQAILEAGLAAPDHGKLKPWRFIVIKGDARQRLGELFVQALPEINSQIGPADVEKQRNGPMRAPVIVAVVAALEPSHPKIPRIEQICSAAAAAQNMLIAAHALGFASKWSTGKNAYNTTVKRGLGVADHEEIVAFLYVGSYGAEQTIPPRPSLADIVSEWQG
ncbi:MAG: nitroreductase [Pseudomonadota bacterium]